MAALTVYDETTLGDRTDEFLLDFLNERITVRELIRKRMEERRGKR